MVASIAEILCTKPISSSYLLVGLWQFEIIYSLLMMCLEKRSWGGTKELCELHGNAEVDDVYLIFFAMIFSRRDMMSRNLRIGTI